MHLKMLQNVAALVAFKTGKALRREKIKQDGMP